MNKKSELIMHPIRMRLVAELGEREMTTRQLADAVPDVAQATLYRHIKRLHDGGIFHIVREQAVNGAVERTYALVRQMNRLTDKDLAGLSAESHSQLFSVFTASLIESFNRYVEGQDSTEFAQNGLSYNQAVVYLSAEERVQFQQQLLHIVSGVLNNGPRADRKRFTLSSVVIPDEREAK